MDIRLDLGSLWEVGNRADAYIRLREHGCTHREALDVIGGDPDDDHDGDDSTPPDPDGFPDVLRDILRS